MKNKVYIIILSYKNWHDTIECMESILRNEYPDYQVIVVDNNSPDNSMEYIKSWIEGKLDVWINPQNPLKNLSFPPLKKPIPYMFYKQEIAIKGGNCNVEKKLEEIIKNISISNGSTLNRTNTKYPVILIQSNQNRGYSAGNNIGIKYALAKNDFKYIWLLNNDTVIEKNSLIELVKCAEQKGEKTSPIGSVLLYYDKPNYIQALGAKFNIFYALGKHLYKLKTLNKASKILNTKKIDYVIGASLLLNYKFIKDVGLLNEEYFIYFEEIDLSIRGKRKGYKIDICLNSIVYHKEAITMKSMPSEFSDFYAMRNRKIFTRKYYPYLLPILYLTYIVSIFKRLKRKEFKKAYNIIKIMFGKKSL